MTWWQRAKERLSDSVGQRVTGLGFAYTGLTLAVGLAAFFTANNLLFLLLAVLLSVLLVSGFVGRLNLAGLQVVVAFPDYVSAGTPIVAAVTLRNLKHWLPAFSLHLRGGRGSHVDRGVFFPVIPGGRAASSAVTLLFPHRGRHREDSFVVSSRFPFGFTERNAAVRVDRELIVFPSLLAQPGFQSSLRDLESSSQMRRRGRGDELYGLRPYAAGEAVRDVDWKTTARRGQLYLREYAQGERHAVEVALDLFSNAATSARFERCLSFAAYVLWTLDERGTPLRLRTQRSLDDTREGANIYDMLRILALAEAQSSAPAIDPDPHVSSILVSVRDARSICSQPDWA